MLLYPICLQYGLGVLKCNLSLLNTVIQSNYKLEVNFIDGTHGVVEMSHRVTSEKAGVFAALKDVNFFNQVHLEHGVATWPNEIDLAPDAMHDEIKLHGKWVLM